MEGIGRGYVRGATRVERTCKHKSLKHETICIIKLWRAAYLLQWTNIDMGTRILMTHVVDQTSPREGLDVFTFSHAQVLKPGAHGRFTNIGGSGRSHPDSHAMCVGVTEGQQDGVE